MTGLLQQTVVGVLLIINAAALDILHGERIVRYTIRCIKTLTTLLLSNFPSLEGDMITFEEDGEEYHRSM